MKPLLVAYLVLVHLALAVLLWKPGLPSRIRQRLGFSPRPEIGDYYRQTLRHHSRSVDAVPDGAVVFIGDSLTQGLAVAAVHPSAVNYGIGGDTTRGVLGRLPAYRPALERAECIVVAIGFNDTRHREADEALRNYARILDALPEDRRVIVSAVLPVDDRARGSLAGRRDWIGRFNAGLRRLAAEREQVTFLDAGDALDRDGDGRLDRSLHDGDGVHLNSAGYRAWAARLADAIGDPGPAAGASPGKGR
jgi:lysophospholipase L1-like esterase